MNPAAAPTDKPGRGARRRAAILAAATEVFLEQGFEGARLEEVIRRSGGSLATLYAQFGGKEGLFAAIIAGICQKMVDSLPGLDDRITRTPDEALFAFARTYLEQLLAPASLALYRVVIGEGARFPELGRAVFEAGPATAAERLAGYLRWEAERGVLVVPDPDLAARLFLEMVKGDLHVRALLASGPAPSGPEIEACVRAATRIFLDGIARRPSLQARLETAV
ncbi:MAG: Transcriptional regulator, AcrR family [uncultured Microvirga sp.]|uniref:Transcriptional regulator, AcrR family n=1 Tax=uncultured Microvirga sp. TaxID=412392 RepID=A0A6J4MQI7_9HYPH|nr:MAG: Transcriptional regulator, AcrR family [uncultured Microvirga sp.]